MFSQAAFPDLLTVLLVRPDLHPPLPKALCPPCETGVLLPCGCRACELCPACGIPMADHVSVSWTITSDHRQLSQRPRVQNQAVCRAALPPKARAGSARLVQRLLADWRFLVSLGLWTHHAHRCLCHRRALLCICVFTVGLTLLVPGADLTVKPPCRPLTDAQKTGMGQEAGGGRAGALTCVALSKSLPPRQRLLHLPLLPGASAWEDSSRGCGCRNSWQSAREMGIQLGVPWSGPSLPPSVPGPGRPAGGPLFPRTRGALWTRRQAGGRGGRPHSPTPGRDLVGRTVPWKG